RRVVHHGGSAEIDPAHGELVEAGGARVLFDQRVLAHHVERQEADAARAERDADLGSCARAAPAAGGAGDADDRGEEQREALHCAATRSAAPSASPSAAARASSPASSSSSIRQHCAISASTRAGASTRTA